MMRGHLVWLTLCTLHIVVNCQTNCYGDNPPPGLCEYLVRISCDSKQILEFNNGEEHTFVCPSSITQPYFRRIVNDGAINYNTNIFNDSRYLINGNSLTISNLQPEDEGYYMCSSDSNFEIAEDVENVPCITVSGVTQFVTCQSGAERLPPGTSVTRDLVCTDSINVTRGQDVIFDTRLTFSESGGCNCVESIPSVEFYERKGHNRETIFSCVEPNCRNGSNFTIVRNGNTDYSFYVQIPSINLSDDSMYGLEVEYQLPRLESNTKKFQKFFSVSVNPAPPSTAPPPTTATSTTLTSNSTDTMIADTLSGSERAGLAVGVVIIVIVILIIVVLAIAFAVYYVSNKQRTSVTMTKEINGQRNRDAITRGSVFDPVTPGIELSSGLESQPAHH